MLVGLLVVEWSKWLGKTQPEQTALDHSLAVGATASLLRNEFLGNSVDSSILAGLGCLHDIGKFTIHFQQSLSSNSNTIKQPYHTTLGIACLDCLIDCGYKQLRDFWKPLKAVVGHHGEPPAEQYQDTRWMKKNVVPAFEGGTAHCLRPEDANAIENLVEWVLNRFFMDEPPIDRSTWLINGLITLSDWLVSEEFFIEILNKKISGTTPGERFRRLLSIIPETNRYKSVTDGQFTAASFSELYPNYAPRPLQEKADTMGLPSEPSLFVFEDTTGSGKTEAAMTLATRLIDADRASSLYFALPTMATSNALYNRVVESDKDHETTLIRRMGSLSRSVVLAHGEAETMRDLSMVTDEETEGTASWLSDSRKLALLTNFGVGTIDQALKSILPSRHHTLRMLGLNDAVLIVDEVHDFDPYVNKLLKRLLSFRAELGLDSILLTATLSERQRREFLKTYASNEKKKSSKSERGLLG